MFKLQDFPITHTIKRKEQKICVRWLMLLAMLKKCYLYVTAAWYIHHRI